MGHKICMSRFCAFYFHQVSDKKKNLRVRKLEMGRSPTRLVPEISSQMQCDIGVGAGFGVEESDLENPDTAAPLQTCSVRQMTEQTCGGVAAC